MHSMTVVLLQTTAIAVIAVTVSIFHSREPCSLGRNKQNIVCVQIHWRMGGSFDNQRLSVHLFSGVWRWVWHLGFDQKLGVTSGYLGHLCKLLSVLSYHF